MRPHGFAILAVLALGSARTAHAQASNTAASGSAQSAAGTIDPTGKFDLDIQMANGQSATGRMVIRGTPGNYAGTLAADGSDGPFLITSITIERDTVLVTVVPEGAVNGVTLHLQYEAEGFSGRFDGMESGQIRGKKIN